jgi:hypothetical protein
MLFTFASTGGSLCHTQCLQKADFDQRVKCCDELDQAERSERVRKMRGGYAHRRCAPILERQTKEIAEPGDHRFGPRSFLLLDQDHDGAERVVEKVRLQLHFEGAYLRRCELLREFGCLHPRRRECRAGV